MKKAALTLLCAILCLSCVTAGATEFNALDYTVFSFGERMMVYQAPGDTYYRDGNAAVGISNKARLYGTMGNWLMVGYGYSTDKFRIGWVETPTPDKDKRTFFSVSDTVGELNFDMVIRRTKDECAATYDPVKISTRNVELKKGAQVTVLCWCEIMRKKWAYVEMRIDKKPSWGFIYADMLESDPVAAPAPALRTNGSAMNRTLKEIATKTPGGHYALFSGPAESYVRAEDGRACVYPEDKCHILGAEGDWALVRVTGERGERYGYIPQAALPDRAKLKEVSFDCTPVLAERAAALLETPDENGAQVSVVYAGAKLNFLAWADNSETWAYVEQITQDTKARGFVPSAILRQLSGS